MCTEHKRIDGWLRGLADVAGALTISRHSQEEGPCLRRGVNVLWLGLVSVKGHPVLGYPFAHCPVCYLLCYECYAENASLEKDMWAIKLIALLTGRTMDVYTRMSDADASDYDKLKKALLTRCNYTEDGCRKRFIEATETEETPDQFVNRLKNYLTKWLELSGSSPETLTDALVHLIVKEQFINACSEDLAMYLLDRGPKDLEELTTWAQKYLIAHKQQLGGKSKATAQTCGSEEIDTVQTDPSQGSQKSLECYCCQGFGHRQSECGTKISPGKDQKGSSTPVSKSSQKKARAMVVQSWEDGEDSLTCVKVEGTRSKRSLKNSGTKGLTNSDRAVYSAVCHPRVMMVTPTLM